MGPGGLGVWRVLRWGQAMDVFVLNSLREGLPNVVQEQPRRTGIKRARELEETIDIYAICLKKMEIVR